MLTEAAFAALVRLFPADYRIYLGDPMARTFEQSARDVRKRGVARVRFVAREFVALAGAIATEWISKLTSDRATRFRALPDCRMMRPAGVARQQWLAGLDWTLRDIGV